MIILCRVYYVQHDWLKYYHFISLYICIFVYLVEWSHSTVLNIFFLPYICFLWLAENCHLDCLPCFYVTWLSVTWLSVTWLLEADSSVSCLVVAGYMSVRVVRNICLKRWIDSPSWVTVLPRFTFVVLISPVTISHWSYPNPVVLEDIYQCLYPTVVITYTYTPYPIKPPYSMPEVVLCIWCVNSIYISFIVQSICIRYLYIIILSQTIPNEHSRNILAPFIRSAESVFQFS